MHLLIMWDAAWLRCVVEEYTVLITVRTPGQDNGGSKTVRNYDLHTEVLVLPMPTRQYTCLHPTLAARDSAPCAGCRRRIHRKPSPLPTPTIPLPPKVQMPELPNLITCGTIPMARLRLDCVIARMS
jgi:hypothetical protein